jgi:hypothetical protein
VRITALAAALLTAFAGPAVAMPVEGRLVVSAFPVVADRLSANLGLEYEIGPRAGHFSFGATGWILGEPQTGAGLFRAEYTGTAFLRGRLVLTAQDEMSVLVGHNYRYKGGGPCFGTCEPPDSRWLILGLAWRHQTERYWLHVTPQYELTWDPRFVGTDGPAFVGGWTSWALPWVEGGFWLTPTLGLGARFGPGIAQAVWRF